VSIPVRKISCRYASADERDRTSMARVMLNYACEAGEAGDGYKYDEAGDGNS